MNPAAAAYENAHVTSLEAQLSRAVDSCMRLRPADPAAYIGVRLISASAVAESPTTPHPATEAVASEPSADAVTSEWKTVSWLDSEETNKELAAAMLGQSFVTGGDELAAMRALGGSATLEDELTVRLAAAIGPLVARLAPRLRALATVEAADVPQASLGWAMNAFAKKKFRSVQKVTGEAMFLMGDDNMMGGAPVAVTSQLAGDPGVSPAIDGEVIFGAWNQVIIAFWSSVEILVNPFETTAYSKGNVQIRGFIDSDVLVRHAQAFVHWQNILVTA